MEDNKHLVSIGMPVYNGEKYVRQALDSLLAQDYEHFELIISDNSSTDRTREICREYAANDERISYYRNAENMGAAWNFKQVLELASGKYFMWAAHDDVWDKRFVEACIQGLESSPQVGWAFSNIVNVDSFGRVIREYPSFGRFVHSDHYLSITSFVLDPEYLGKANLLYGVFKLDNLREFMIRFWVNIQENYSATDVAFNLGILCRTRLYIDERVLFMKRIVRLTDSKERIDKIVPVAPYARGMNRQDFLDFNKATMIACRGTQFEDLVSYLMNYRECMANDILHIINEGRDNLLNSTTYTVGKVMLTPLIKLTQGLGLLKKWLRK